MNQLELPNVADMEREDAKQLLRSALRTHRKERSASAREASQERYLHHVLHFIKGHKRVACYVSVNAEPPTTKLCPAIADSGVELLLPKLGPGLTRSWGFFRGNDDLTQLAPGRPPEPTGPAFDNNIVNTVDVMIIPALAVSRSGQRLGQGGGWYDRALKEIGEQTKVAAIVYPEELVDINLPQDEMDVLVPFVITEEGITATTAA